MSSSVAVGAGKALSVDTLSAFAFGSGPFSVADERGAPGSGATECNKGSTNSHTGGSGGALLHLADAHQCLLAPAVSPAVGQLQQPHAPLTLPASRAVALLRAASLEKSGVSRRLLEGLAAASANAGSAACPLPRCSSGGWAKQPRPPLVALLCAAASAAQIEAVSLETAAFFLTDAPEIVGRSFVVARCCSVAARLATCCTAAAAEALLLPADAVADVRRLLSASPGLAEVSEHLGAMLHDMKLQQQRRSAAECRDALAAFTEIATAVGALQGPLLSLLALTEVACKRQMSKPKNLVVDLPAAAAADGLSAEASLEAAAAAAASIDLPLSGPASPFRAAIAAAEMAARALLLAELKLLRATVQMADQQQKSRPEEPVLLPEALSSAAEYFGKGGEARLTAAGIAEAANTLQTLQNSAEEAERRCVSGGSPEPLESLSRLEDVCLLLQQALGLHAGLLLQCVEERDVATLREAAAKVQRGKKGAATRWAATQGVRAFIELLRRIATSVSPELSPNAAVAVASGSLCSSGGDWLWGGRGAASSWELPCGSVEAALSLLLSPSNALRRLPKVPKGTQDFSPERLVIRNLILETVTACFRRHGAQPIDTPVFELRETLLGKYGGEASKLVFELKDQGGEQLCLRYDLTVPFARYMAANALTKMRRYHVGKVYRRDEPQMNRGRFREFYQCDFDIAGDVTPPLLADAECLSLLCEILAVLRGITGAYLVKLNTRKLLDGILAFCGVPQEQFCSVCSSIDKLDKEPWEAVAEELQNSKGVPAATVEKLKGFVLQKGDLPQMLARLQQDAALMQVPAAAAAASDFAQLLVYVEPLGLLPELCWDWSLARGLDYYTGIIFEAVLLKRDGTCSGSIAGGGRYDGLVSLFSSKDVPAVGFSVGVERLFALMESMLGVGSSSDAESSNGGSDGLASSARASCSAVTGEGVRKDFTDILVCNVGKGMLPYALSAARLLWSAGLSCELFYGEDVRLKKQLDTASAKKVPWVVLCAEEEAARRCVKVKKLYHCHEATSHSQQQEQEQIDEEIPLDGLIQFFKEHLKETVYEAYTASLLLNPPKENA
ncbi:uncharacterized protein LOC34622279 [Cyclospora cayetanensis]|uniref:histidine--tRNA ligase n=1 Tax=Cyclospora cayetanensis TaxID=88456 RepID=A0A6P6RQN0_9EIME|nr:uncharacterized protein LOC34622279 [Cyclospora cayetanensis]